MHIRQRIALAVLLAAGAPSLAFATDPSVATTKASAAPAFNCARAKSPVEHLICVTPELAQLDVQLDEVFRNSSGQAGLDAKVLRKQEDAWLVSIRDTCTDVACLETAYTQRIQALKDQSLQAASPAAYAETRPFAVDPSTLAYVKRLVGKSCSILSAPGQNAWTGFSQIKGFEPIIVSGATVRPMMKDQTRFAFLTTVGEDGSCQISDVVALPDAETANAFLQCDSPMPTDSAPGGFGMRLVGDRKVVAFWAIDTQLHQLQRLPLGVLGVEKSMHCREPETGE